MRLDSDPALAEAGRETDSGYAAAVEAMAETLWRIDTADPWDAAPARSRSRCLREAKDILRPRLSGHPRRIRSRNELDTLLNSTEGLHGAVVRDLHGNIYEATCDPARRQHPKAWIELGSAGPYCLSGRIALTARLIWHPDWLGALSAAMDANSESDHDG